MISECDIINYEQYAIQFFKLRDSLFKHVYDNSPNVPRIPLPHEKYLQRRILSPNKINLYSASDGLHLI